MPGKSIIYFGECLEDSEAQNWICVRKNEAYSRYIKYFCMKHLECKEILDDYWRKEIITISQQKNRFPMPHKLC